MNGFNEQRFFKYWKIKSAEIEKLEFDKNQVRSIFELFRKEILNNLVFIHSGHIQEAIETMDDLEIALQRAFSNYRKQNKTFWASVFGSLAGPFLKKIEIPSK